ncbi:hypothetical protein [Hymenobacter cellulosilyticus]|uniref:MipA/OmpV family protein n=1 Tax=Hymenobacter cellulosilyticus TaxID=2932248 RepID=A0A8T9Q4D5_9BACT|nr:hypothetical protein [Hymenobacter cellulosilyticus]UOQ72444.1 hypothetical protein MUN79_00040 [Hymenobacter cellulosilyticus]
MRTFLRFLLLTGIVGAATAAQAQRRVNQDLILVPELQVEVPWHARDYVLASYNRVVFPQGSGNGSGGGQLRLGYEYFWNERWSGGATLRTLFSGAEGLGDFIGQPGG